jgi:hypothetical protein
MSENVTMGEGEPCHAHLSPGKTAGPRAARRRQHDRIALTGMIEMVERGERRAFHDIEELWGILCGTTGQAGDASQYRERTNPETTGEPLPGMGMKRHQPAKRSEAIITT